MERLTVKNCRELMAGGVSLSDQQVELLRNEIYALAGVIVDAWDSLGDPETDQSQFSPPGDIVDQLFPASDAKAGSRVDFWMQNFRVEEFEQ